MDERMRAGAGARQVRLRITFFRALRSEMVRLRRSPLLALHGGVAVAAGVLAGLYFGHAPWDPYLGCDAFFQLLGAGASLLAGLSCGLAIDAEREAGDCANLLGCAARRRVLMAKGAVLLGLGTIAAMLAAGCFAAIMLALGRPVPPAPALAAAVAGLMAGSIASYVLSMGIALAWGKNAAIGWGAFGFMAAIASVGGLGNGVVTATFSGAFNAGPLLLAPFSWPLRLPSLAIELAVAPVAAVANAGSQVPVLRATFGMTAAACFAVTAVVLLAGAQAANRFERTGRAGE